MLIDQSSNQLIVTLFLFYSGYGIYESIKTKENYMRGFLRKRFFPVWLNFAICVSFFLIYDCIVGQEYDIPTILFSFIGWKSVGNSTWFMFVTFVLYLLVYFVFYFFQRNNTLKNKNNILPLCIFTLGTVFLVIALYYLKTPTWYNTVFCFPLGMWYSFYKDKINRFLKTHYWLALLVTVLLFCGFYYLSKRYSPLLFCVCSCIFTLLVVIVTVRVRFRSPIFAFLGKHVFSIYILQRLVFMVFQNCFDNIYIFFIVSFAVTILVATIYDKCFNSLLSVWIKRVNRKLSRET